MLSRSLHSRGRRFCLAAAFMLVYFAGNPRGASAHDVGLSFGNFRVQGGSLYVQFTFARPDLDLPLDIFTPLAMFATDPQVVALRAESKFKTFKELIEAARREPETIPVGITGPTGTARLAFHIIERATGTKFKYVSFKGGGEAVLATLGGHVEVTGENMSEMLPLVEAKKMRVLAVAGERRFKQAPDIPTTKELGFNIIAATGRGFAMPAGVPKEAAVAMEAALKKVYDSPEYKEYSYRNMFDNSYLNSAGFAKYLAENRAVHEEFLKAIGVVK